MNTSGEARLKSTVRFVETMPLFPEEVKLIKYCREFGWGEFTLVVKDGIPVMIHKAREDQKLTED